MQERGEHAYGYDVWTKSVERPVVAERYRKHLAGVESYHQDHGNGMDAYTVGPTLGGGTAALVDSTGALVYPRSFASYKILDNGPLRFSVKLTYAPLLFEGDTIVEERTITLDAHADLNRTEVRYQGLSHPAQVAAGIVVHASNPESYTIMPQSKAFTYADLTDNPDGGNGTIWLALVAPQADSLAYSPLEVPGGDAVGHLLARATILPGESFAYLWGSGWSKGFVQDADAWQQIVEQAALSLHQPLNISR